MTSTISLPIATSFNSFPKISWIQTTFPIGASVSQPLSGHLTDIFGRRKGLISCYVAFAIGTLLCGLAPAIWTFLLGRILQGMGGGAIISITAFVETDLIPLRKRAFVEGLGNICYGVVLALGGVYGGSIDTAIGWKWAFRIIAPIILVNAAIVACAVNLPQRKHPVSSLRRIDYVGIITLTASIVLMQIALNTGGSSTTNNSRWTSSLVLATLTLSPLFFLAFIYWELKRASHPVIPLRALVHRTVSSSQLSFFFASASQGTILFYVPIYLQSTADLTASAAGLRFIPLAACVALSSAVTGYVVKLTGRYVWVNIPVQMSSLAGTALLCTMDERTSAWKPFVYLAFCGIGNGGAVVTRLMGVLTSTAGEEQVRVQAAGWTVESLGLAIGITVAGTVYQRVLRDKLRVLPGLEDRVDGVLDGLSGEQKNRATGAYADAVRAAFFVALGEAIVASLASFLMRNNLVADDDDEIEGTEQGVKEQ
ncbi:MAG: hypothetical protein Q9160_003227 [Pyrenula sp. 1 TL-2023]